MSVLSGILKEEIIRLERNVSLYESNLLKLPKGTIFIRKIGKINYVYRSKKVDGVVVCEYLGKEGSEAANKGIELASEYKRIRDNLKVSKQELYKLRKAILVYERK